MMFLFFTFVAFVLGSLSDPNQLGLFGENLGEPRVYVVPGELATATELPMLTSEQFYSRHAEPKTPFVLRGGARGWPARSRWSREELVHRVGNVTGAVSPVPVRGGPLAVAELGESDRGHYDAQLQFHEFLRKSTLPDTGTGIAGLVFDDALPANLTVDCAVPHFLVCGSFHAESAWWRVSSALVDGMYTPLAMDRTHRLVCQVKGSTRWYLAAPEHAAALFAQVPDHDDEDGEEYAQASGFISPVDPADVDLDGKHGSVADVPFHGFHLAPGDCVYVPADWHHHSVAIIDDSAGSSSPSPGSLNVAVDLVFGSSGLKPVLADSVDHVVTFDGQYADSQCDQLDYAPPTELIFYNRSSCHPVSRLSSIAAIRKAQLDMRVGARPALKNETQVVQKLALDLLVDTRPGAVGGDSPVADDSPGDGRQWLGPSVPLPLVFLSSVENRAEQAFQDFITRLLQTVRACDMDLASTVLRQGLQPVDMEGEDDRVRDFHCFTFALQGGAPSPLELRENRQLNSLLNEQYADVPALRVIQLFVDELDVIRDGKVSAAELKRYSKLRLWEEKVKEQIKQTAVGGAGPSSGPDPNVQETFGIRHTRRVVEHKMEPVDFDSPLGSLKRGEGNDAMDPENWPKAEENQGDYPELSKEEADRLQHLLKEADLLRKKETKQK